MSTTLARRLTVLNSHGIYCRPAALLVKTVWKIAPNTTVTISSGEYVGNAMSIMDWLCLEGNNGKQLRVEARGPEARDVLEAIAQLFNQGFMSGEPCLPIPPAHSETIELPDPDPAPPGDPPKDDRRACG